VDHRFNGVIVQNFRHQRFITNIAFDKGGCFPAETFNDRQYAALTVAEIVENNHFMSLQQQLNAGMTSNVTATTCNQYFHDSLQ
jgi:hypothetical protein